MRYDLLIKRGMKALHCTLVAADGRSLIDGAIQSDLDQLLAEMAKGISLGGGKLGETVGLIRLIGYVCELATAAGMMAAFGFRFALDERGRLVITFHPELLDPALGQCKGLNGA